jgi:peptide deformylase
MAEHESASSDAPFQKWLPLRVVDISEMPHPSKIADASVQDVAFLASLAKNMVSLCMKNHGVGLAAVQCGIPLKLFIASIDGLTFRCFFNMEYTSEEKKQDSLEGCLSIKDKKGNMRRFLVKRFNHANFSGKEILLHDTPPAIVEVREAFAGLFSVVCQHEIDHHNGILISDHGKEVEVVN